MLKLLNLRCGLKHKFIRGFLESVSANNFAGVSVARFMESRESGGPAAGGGKSDSARLKRQKRKSEVSPSRSSKTPKTMDSSSDLGVIPTNPLHNLNITYLTPPTKSPNDKKEYTVIKLSNGLTALLIADVAHLLTNVDEKGRSNSVCSTNESEDESSSSDSSVSNSEDDDVDVQVKPSKAEEKLAACALCIGVGSFSDPEEIPGLAHFLEHMVFMGSEKFPMENDFDSYISKHGGSDNAGTECEITTFYFDCHEVHLHSAMDRFSHFFISPLFKRGAMTREREAVESEFQMALPSDSTRREQLFCSTAVQSNPAHKFMWGNLITLRDNVTDDVLYQSLREFWKRHYSAHRMTLAVQARLPTKVLENWVVECFSEVPTNNLPPLVFQYVDPPFKPEAFCKYLTVEPVKDICKVEVTWSFPSVLHLYKSKPYTYISWLIGHEGEGSLISYLRKKLWALNIAAGNAGDGIDSNSMYSLFSIDICLTDEGLEHIEDVLLLVFKYIKLLQATGPVEWIFREIQSIEDTSFRFHEETPPSDYVESIVETMQVCPSVDYITGDELLFEYKPEIISDFLQRMLPDNCNIMVSSKIAAKTVTLDRVEPWFKTRYHMSDIPQKWIEDWKTCSLDENFSLPKPNVYITTNFDLLSTTNDMPEYPQKILQNEFIELWYKQDKKFQLPLGFITVNLISPITFQTVQNSVMVDLLVGILKQHVIEEAYPALMAHLQYSITIDKGIIIQVNGYNQNLGLLLDTLLHHLTSFHKYATPGLFEAIKKEQSKCYFNTSLKSSDVAKEIRLKILMNPYWSVIEKHKALSQITLPRLKQFSIEFCQQLYVQCHIQGNISQDVALGVTETIQKTLGFSPIQQSSFPEIRICQIPKGEKCCRVEAFNRDDTNCNVTNYYQSGLGNLEERCKVELLMMLMEEPLFDTLRTKEQLGYAVSCQFRDTSGILGFTVTVKSQVHKHSVDHVECRITEFLRNFVDYIKDMPEEDFLQVRASLVKLKQCVDIHIKEEIKRNWEEIKVREYMFDRLKREVLHIEKFSREDIYRYLEKCINHDDKEPTMRKLSIQVEAAIKKSSSLERNKGDDTEGSGNDTSEGVRFLLSHTNELKVKLIQPKNDCDKFIKDIDEMKCNMFLYPVFKLS